jgi:hypothetical protein
MTDHEDSGHDTKKGITLSSEGASTFLTDNKMEIEVGPAKIHISPDKIEIKVGESQLVVTAGMIQVNGKTHPLG